MHETFTVSTAAVHITLHGSKHRLEIEFITNRCI